MNFLYPCRDRSYSIVMAMNRTMAEKCKLFDSSSQLLLNWYDPELHPSRVPSVIYREILPNGNGKSVQEMKEKCMPQQKCDDGNFIRSVMQDYYPTIDVFRCNPETGIAEHVA